MGPGTSSLFRLTFQVLSSLCCNSLEEHIGTEGFYIKYRLLFGHGFTVEYILFVVKNVFDSNERQQFVLKKADAATGMGLGWDAFLFRIWRSCFPGPGFRSHSQQRSISWHWMHLATRPCVCDRIVWLSMGSGESDASRAISLGSLVLYLLLWNITCVGVKLHVNVSWWAVAFWFLHPAFIGEVWLPWLKPVVMVVVCEWEVCSTRV